MPARWTVNQHIYSSTFKFMVLTNIEVVSTRRHVSCDLFAVPPKINLPSSHTVSFENKSVKKNSQKKQSLVKYSNKSA